MAQQRDTLRRRGALRVSTLLVAATLAICAGSGATIAATGTAPSTHALLMAHVPAAVSGGQATRIAALPSTQHLKLAINLPARNQAELDGLLQRLQDPRSPDYRHYLGVDEFTARFGPTQADYDAVVAWAGAQGLAVRRTTPNRHLVDIDGSVDAINRALHVSMGSYRDAGARRTFFAPDREPTVDLAVPLLQVTGLDNYTLPTRHSREGTPAEKAGAIAHATGSGPGGEFLPSDMRAAYYGSGPLTGAGQTVGVFSFDGYLSSDVDLYYSRTGMTSNVPVNNVLVNGYSGACDDGGASCDDGEQVLDIVNVIGMAPGITQILFYEGDSGPDILNQMATDNSAKVLSCSWGSSDMGHVADPIFEEFQAQGQTFLNATGDDGAYNSHTWLPPSLNSLTLQIGATDLTTHGAGGGWSAETGWPDSGGGFYAPAGYSIPDFQQIAGVINTSNAGSTTLRNDPDVAAEGNFDNPTVSNGQFLTGYGGTSFAAPRWAGFIALANEQSTSNGGASLGFVNPAIYATATGADFGGDFHDVISGHNPPSSGGGSGFFAVAGYDLVTGWGSPNGDGLIGDLSGSTTTPGYVLAAYPPNPSMTIGSSVDIAIGVDTLNGFGDDVTLAATGLPAGVSAAFSPPSSSTGSTLTLTSTSAAAIGTAVVTIAGTAGSLVQTTSVTLLIGNPAAATVTPAALDFNVVPLGSVAQTLAIANAANSVPLTYSVTAGAVAAGVNTSGVDGGTCSGGTVPWLAASGSGTVAGGQSAGVSVAVDPSAASLAPGSYTANVCVTTNDSANALVVVPVNLVVNAGPLHETIFLSGFESGETGGGAGIVTFVIDQPVEDDQAGSALDLATGNFHTWNASTLDNINPYDDGTGLQVYWYNDQVPSQFSDLVGGVVDSGGSDYAVLQSGAVIGPDSTIVNATTPMTNWWGGVDGYIGIAFLNSQTGALNYGYIHMTTTSPHGFPAEVLDYGFDSSGAAITIP